MGAAPEERYARHYWRFADEFPDVYGDDSALALWHRLVRLADMAWPAAASLPFGVKKTALSTLTKARDGGPLIVLITATHTYRVRGMDKERGKRSQSGKDAADARWGNAPGTASSNAVSSATRNAVSSATGNAESMPSRAEESRAEQSRGEREARATDEAENDPWRADEAEAVDWLRRHKCQIREGDGYHVRLVTAVERHGVNAIVGQFDRLARAGTQDGDIKGFLFGAIDLLDARGRPSVRELEAEERRDESRAVSDARVAETLRRNRERYPNLFDTPAETKP